MTTAAASVRGGLSRSMATATVTRRAASPSRVTMLDENRSSMVSTSAAYRWCLSAGGLIPNTEDYA
jgi:hypothetical protein